MVTLSGSDRSLLEKAVLKARDVSEDGVRKRLAAMDLNHEERPAGITDQENELRKALRVRARHLGRGRVDAHLANNEAVEQGLPFLVEELAYEAWHRMLFARFLAENELLTHPELGISVSTEDLFALAAEEGRDPWELAADYAANRLPGLFALKTPLRLATEDRQDLTQILGSLDATLFTASDSLGWVYQFWQAKRKKEVNAAGNKIDGNTLPAVTQLFTEDYMVDFLLQNSLGAWYVARHPETPLKDNWPYLRFLGDGTPAAGAFPTWPDDIAEVTVMDPCCGSGHFLVAALHMLVDMRMEVEGISASDATDRVLQHNLFGLELDARCTQIATFAVALEAWKRGGHPEKHLPQVACSGIPVGGQKDEWIRLARNDATLINILGDLYDRFSQAAELGSLINPEQSISIGDLWKFEWSTVESRVGTFLNNPVTDQVASGLFESDDLSGTMHTARLLMQGYTLVVTNVPFLGRIKQSNTLTEFIDRFYSSGRADLATALLLRFVDHAFCKTIALVLPDGWFFQNRERDLRREILETSEIRFAAQLGIGAFGHGGGGGVQVSLFCADANAPSLENEIVWIDASKAVGSEDKATRLISGELTKTSQQRSFDSQGLEIERSAGKPGVTLGDFVEGVRGLSFGDGPNYIRNFWEISTITPDWEYFHDGVPDVAEYTGRSEIILWENENGRLYRLAESVKHLNHAAQSWRRGKPLWGTLGVAYNRMGALNTTIYTGDRFSGNTAVFAPKDLSHLPAVWSFLSSEPFKVLVREGNNKLAIEPFYVLRLPFDFKYWQRIADEQYPNGLPEPYSSDPTQWLFEGTVPESDHPLQVAMARMLGYRWPEQVEDGLDALADPDGIVCLPSVYQEPPAHQRLQEVLQRAYGDAWSNEVLTGLLQQVGATSLEAWLSDKSGFFLQHTKLFHNRPFLWQITDGRKDGFSAIVNYHRLDSATLNKLIHTYLGDWVQRQQRAAAQGEAGAQGRLEAATALKAKLDAIYAGEPPYDIYVRWKPLAEQSIGWNPDLNDGVRLNIRPFIEAGVLANKVTVNWNKDRGKDPFVREEPLLADTRDAELRKRLELHCSVDRWNDLHFSRAEKERARALASQAE